MRKGPCRHSWPVQLLARPASGCPPPCSSLSHPSQPSPPPPTTLHKNLPPLKWKKIRTHSYITSSLKNSSAGRQPRAFLILALIFSNSLSPVYLGSLCYSFSSLSFFLRIKCLYLCSFLQNKAGSSDSNFSSESSLAVSPGLGMNCSLFHCFF